MVRDHNKLQGFKKEMCGPYPVMEVLAGNNYKLHMPDNPRRHSRLHVNMLEKYVTPIAECLWTDEDLQDLGPEMLRGAIGDVPEPEIYLEKEDRRKLRKLLVEYKDIFQSKPRRTSTTKLEINTADAYPIHLPAYRVPPIKLPMLEQEVKSLLEEGIIEQSSSQWAYPAIIVLKPNGGIRLCIDHRKLNEITTPDVFPMPLIEDFIDRLAQSKVISVLDLAKGYYQVPVHPNSVDKTAFVTPLGRYSFLVMPFGLCGAPAVFQRLMNTVLDGLVKFSSCYNDDIAVYSDSIIDHFEHLREVLTRLRVHGLILKAIKCQLFHKRVTYLGNLVGGGEVRPLLPKIQVLKDFLRQKTKRQLRSFLGLSNYYRKYKEHYADKAHPLYDALKRNEPDSIAWNESSERAFLKLKYDLLRKLY